ncbi:DNA topoisomerase, partial [Mycobacterium kansasii]
FKTPGQLHSSLDNDEFRLYELIWQRTVASQMADARGTTLSLRLAGTATSGEQVVFTASGRTITFPGFLSAYVETVDELSGGEAD